MTISVGDKIPAVTLRIMGEDGIGEVTTDDLFSGKTVALFALPGAFTPTCSAKHLPGYVDNAERLGAKGIDDIICLSVNDAFVMDAWGKSQDVGDRVKMVADGNGDFATAVGLEMDGSGSGMGRRSRRYSMVVEDGVVKILNIEAPRQFEVSGAETMLDQL